MQTDRNTTGHLSGITGQASTGLRWREGVAILTLATATTVAWGQTTPNWGALSTASPQRAELATVATPASAPTAKSVAPATALGAKPTLTTSAVGAKAALLPSTKPALEKPALLPPAEVVAHLKSAGLDAKDPALGAKLKALAQQHGVAYVRSRVTSMAPVVVKKAAPPPRPGSPKGNHSVAARPQSSMLRPVVGKIITWAIPFIDEATTGALLAPNWYDWLVSASSKDLAGVKGTLSVAFDCGGFNQSWGVSLYDINDPYLNGLFPTVSRTGESGPPYTYVVRTEEGGFGRGFVPIGRNRSGQVTIRFLNVSASTTATFAPSQATVTISATIDHTPTLTGIGSVSPWGATGLSAGNATLQNSDTPRVGLGDWTVNTQGSDLIGDGVQLGPGWTVTSTVIKSAISATTPQDLSPDTSWRGAKVTQTPSPGTLRTGVAWHYGGIDSLDYTVEWTLTGPLGQRPLMTMAKHDSCDN